MVLMDMCCVSSEPSAGGAGEPNVDDARAQGALITRQRLSHKSCQNAEKKGGPSACHCRGVLGECQRLGSSLACS